MATPRKRKEGGKLASWLREAARKQRRPAAKPAPAPKPAASGGKLSGWLEEAAKVQDRERRAAEKRIASRRPVSGAVLARWLRRQEEDAKAAAVFRKATGKFRPRKAEADQVVFVSARTGKRVGRGFRGKVFPLYVGKDGKVRPYTERGRRNRPPLPRTIRSIDPGQFRQKRAKAAAQRMLYAKATRLVEPAVVRAPKAAGGVDWDKRVVPAVVDKLLAFAGVNTRTFQAAVQWTAVVQVGTEFRTYDGAVDWKLSQAQVDAINSGELPAQWAEPWIRQKLYSAVAERIGQAEFVTAGSAAFVSRLAANRGKPREKWTDGKGRRWVKWDWQVVTLRTFTVEPRLVRVESAG